LRVVSRRVLSVGVIPGSGVAAPGAKLPAAVPVVAPAVPTPLAPVPAAADPDAEAFDIPVVSRALLEPLLQPARTAAAAKPKRIVRCMKPPEKRFDERPPRQKQAVGQRATAHAARSLRRT
jgi:hypothetical protein